MSPSLHPVTPDANSSLPRVLQVTLATARPNMSGPFTAYDKPVGVAALVTAGERHEPHWMAGYAKSDDMARAAMIHHLLRLPEYSGARLDISTVGLADILSHVRGARDRGGLKTNGKPFDAFDIFDPVEAALSRGEWSLQTPDYGAAYVNRGGAEHLAGLAQEVAMLHSHQFTHFTEAHPDWWMLRVGRTATPQVEHHEPR